MLIKTAPKICNDALYVAAVAPVHYVPPKLSSRAQEVATSVYHVCLAFIVLCLFAQIALSTRHHVPQWLRDSNGLGRMCLLQPASIPTAVAAAAANCCAPATNTTANGTLAAKQPLLAATSAPNVSQQQHSAIEGAAAAAQGQDGGSSC